MQSELNKRFEDFQKILDTISIKSNYVDVIAVSVLSGAHMTIFPKILKLLKDQEINDILLTGGGIIPQKDIDELMQMGVGQLFGPGTPVKQSLDYIQSWVKNNRE